MEFSELNALRRDFAKGNGTEAADALIAKYGGTTDNGEVSLSAVAEENYAALAADFGAGAKAKATPRSLAEIHDRAFRRFNAPKKRES